MKTIILTPEQINQLAPEEYEAINTIFYNAKIIHGFQGLFKGIDDKILKSINEQQKQFDLNEIQIQLCITKMYFPDLIEIANILRSARYHQEDIHKLIIAIRTKKQQVENPGSISNDELLEAMAKIEAVIKLYKASFGINRELDPNEEIVIMNSIVEVYTKCKQYFMKTHSSHEQK